MINSILKYKKNCSINIESEVCIIGAGTAGIYLAQSLAKKNIKVSLIEVGSYSTAEPCMKMDHPNF